MTILSAPYKQMNQEKHLNLDREGENEEAADGRNISMAAGSRFHLGTASVSCWE